MNSAKYPATSILFDLGQNHILYTNMDGTATAAASDLKANWVSHETPCREFHIH